MGQKKTKKSDFEVIPAPDSKQAMEIILENSPVLSSPSDSQNMSKSTKKSSCLKKNSAFSEQKLNTPVGGSVKSFVNDSIQKIPNSMHNSKQKRRSLKRLNFGSSPENKKRVRLCIPEKSPLNTCEELIDLENIETSETSTIADFEEPWLLERNLTLRDKKIITNNEWLSDKHMLAVSNILRKQFPQINGLQDTKNAPFFMEEKQFWNTSKQFKPQVSPSVQLHFDGINHWTMSFSSSKDEESIYYIDSLGANLKDLKNNVKIQLSQIYRTTSAVLQVKIPRVQQQPNSYDCGLFAIANVVEFCFAPDSFNTRVTYNVSKMREHSIECLENGKMSEFPKEKVRGRCKLNSFTCKVVKIPIWCFCKMPECIDNITENRKCKTWFHGKCLDLDSVENEWQCPSCEHQNQWAVANFIKLGFVKQFVAGF